MNKRSRNSRRNAAVFLGQLVERRDGVRIAQHHGDLPALCAQRRLTLGAGLWLNHELLLWGEQLAAVFCIDGFRAWLVQPKRNAFCINVDPFTGRSRKHQLRHFRRNVLGILEDGASINGVLRGGPIPPMNESYAVTSDASTTFDIAPQQACA